MTHNDAKSWIKVIFLGVGLLVVVFEVTHHYFDVPARSIIQSVLEKAKARR